MTPQPHPLRCETCTKCPFLNGTCFDERMSNPIAATTSMIGCASHSAASRPTQSRNILDTDLCVCGLTEQECQNKINKAAAKAREDFIEKAEHLAQTIPDFNRMDYIHLLKESLRTGGEPR